MAAPDAFSIVVLAAVGAVFIAYNVTVVARAHGGGGAAALHAVILESGSAFIAKHLEKDDAATSTLAVQSLRNTVLVAIFIGGIAFQAFQVSAAAAGAAGDAAAAARLLILSAFLLASFLNFALVIRAASHLAYVLGGARHAAAAAAAGTDGSAAEEGRGAAAAAAARHSRTVASLCRSLMRGLSLHFSLGFRCLYASVPYSFAAAGPVALVVAAGGMLAFLAYADFGMTAHGRHEEELE